MVFHLDQILPYSWRLHLFYQGRPARTYAQQSCADTGYGLEDCPGVIGDRDGWQESQEDPCWQHDMMMMMMMMIKKKM